MKSKKILAALVAIPASVVVAGEVQAEEVTITQTFDIQNIFTGSSTILTQSSTKLFLINDEEDLKNQILIEMSKFNKGFTVMYTGPKIASYEILIEQVMAELTNSLNTQKTVTTTSNDTATFDVTEIYGLFNNMRMKATETKADDATSVKLEFSLNYYDTITNNQPKNLNAAKAKYDDIKTKVEAAPNDVAKIKIIHDYVVHNTNYVEGNHHLIPTSGLSSHAYALWMYTLLKQVPSIDVKYVYGIVNGEYRSWNVVKIGTQLYHLDAGSNDTAIKSDKLIQYRYFLTNTPNERRIANGAEGLTITSTTYNHFKTIDNQAQSSTHIYYPNAHSSGEIYQLDLASLTATPLAIDRIDATTGTGRIVYYEQTSGDSANIEPVGKYLYFINDSQGKYLYRYDLGSSKKLELVLKEQLQSIKLGTNILTYTPVEGTPGFLPLARMSDLNEEKANKVIIEIQKLVETANQTTTPSFKTAVMATRQLYMDLTEQQQLLVTNYFELQKIEKSFSLGDVNSSVIIDLINDLDEMSAEYVKKVDDALSGYNTLNNKSAVYNYPILQEAVKKVEAARKLKKDLDTKVEGVKNGDPFEEIPEFIVFVEDFLKKYDGYLPSIRFGIQGLGDIEAYRQRTEELRGEAQDFIHAVKIIDESATDFLTSMKDIQIQYDDLLISQKHLMSSTDGNIVRDKLALMQSMNNQIERFNLLMDDLTTSEQVTEELVEKVREAKKVYDEMKQSQKAAISVENTNKFTTLINRLNGLSEDTALNALITSITNLDFANMGSLDSLVSQITSADSVSVVATKLNITVEQVLALLSAEVREKLLEYRKLKDLATTLGQPLLKDMAALHNGSMAVVIQEIRQRYTDLLATDNRFEMFFTEELKNLVEQEARIMEDGYAKDAQTVINKIKELTEQSSYMEVQSVYQEYQALTAEAKNLVNNKEDLIALWEKVSNDEAVFQKAIDDVNKAIEALNNQSTKEDIEKVREAYNSLSQDQQEKINNYGKLDILLFALEELEVELTNKAASERVIEMIQVLNNESTSAEIKAARATYEALTEEGKKLINERVLQNLVYFESLLATQTEQAEKEAKTVMDRINRIDKTKYTEAQIKSIRMAYNALSDLAKSLVTNLYLLIDAENHVIYQNTVVKQAKLDANAFDLYMDTITRNSTTQEIARARSLYNNLAAEAKRHVTTLEKLVRLETMWNDPQYLELVYTYYPDYVHAVKPGAIVVEKPTYDPLYIPDDSIRTPSSMATKVPKTANWTQYETMTYQNGRYTTQITSTQVKNIADRNMRLKAGDVEIIIPTSEIQASTAAIGVALNITNNQLNIQFTEGNHAKTFSSYVEIRVPISTLKANASQIIERVTATGTSPASFKVDGSNFIIRTTSGGTFKSTTSDIRYTDIQNTAQGNAIRELAKRGITFNTTNRLVESYKQVNKLDAMTMIASALDLSGNSKSEYLDLENTKQSQLAQGLLEAGIMSGATSSRFNPTAPITKQEAAIIIANIYRYLNQDLSKGYNDLTSNYRDIANLSFEARQSISILEQFGVVDGTGAFNPTQTLSRGEFAELFYKALSAIDYL
ncbi:S-layer homology domain-containing protein [Solibacillus ferritrahens]|uniref:S-layer homology domain-containing protein n=1 Tax=Solibacillus ferritrahens TaxID=3098620 RepID=UPI00300A99C5